MRLYTSWQLNVSCLSFIFLWHGLLRMNSSELPAKIKTRCIYMLAYCTTCSKKSFLSLIASARNGCFLGAMMMMQYVFSSRLFRVGDAIEYFLLNKYTKTNSFWMKKRHYYIHPVSIMHGPMDSKTLVNHISQ